MKDIKTIIRKDLNETKVLFRSLPAISVSFFILSVVLMNVFANKEISTGLDWLALDSGIMVSWLSFLSMDALTKRFGPKASIKVSIFALFVNLIVSFIFILVASVKGNWGEFYTFENEIVNQALNSTFKGAWFIIMGSSVAFLVSAIVNALVNYGIGKALKKKEGFFPFIIRSYLSTMIGQFVDNLIFAEIVSYNFFGWSQIQCVTCALTGMVVELLLEIVFSYFGYVVSRGWERNGVGEEYLNLIKGEADL